MVLFYQKKLPMVFEGISNFEINEVLKNENNFKGYFMLDEKLPGDGNFVLNLDDSSGDGTHWVCVFETEYYDSFGLVPPKCLEKRIDWYNVRQHQKINSKLCGLYCMYYIQCRNRGLTPYRICYKKLSATGNAKLLQDQYGSVLSKLQEKDA